MGKIFLTAVFLYAFFVGIYFLRLNAGKKRKKSIIGQGSAIQETGHLKTNIIGKSRFDLNLSKPLAAKLKPLTSTSLKSEKEAENPDIFAPPNEVKPSATVPPEEFDEVFSDTPPDEESELTDINYSLEYETDGENESEPDGEEETEEVEGAAQAAFASGVQFDDLGNVVRTVYRTDKATSEQKVAAGNTLLEMRRTDMFEQLVSEKLDAKKIVTDLMEESLAVFNRRKDKEAGTSGSGRKAPDNFNIRDFA